jgi:cytochrome c-type biogenesis protein CcmH
MGWAILLLLVMLALGTLWTLKVRGGLLKATAAALLLGASGYALQGRPDLAGSPVEASEARDVLPLTEARHAFFGPSTRAESWLVTSEALARDGRVEDSILILQNAVKRYPGDAQLWIGLGNALVDHGHGLAPPAELAYQRAAEVAPANPAPPFFDGLALARSGDREGAIRLWTQILQHAPKDAAWRALVEQGVAALGKPGADPAPAGS